jgi:hypothetical protein
MTALSNRFQPTLETLESRDLPSAHLAASLAFAQAPPADAAHVRVLQDVASDLHVGHSTRFDDQRAGAKVLDMFDKLIVANGWNIWGIQSVKLNWANSGDCENGYSFLNVELGVHTAAGDQNIQLQYEYLGRELGQLDLFQLRVILNNHFWFLDPAIHAGLDLVASKVGAMPTKGPDGLPIVTGQRAELPAASHDAERAAQFVCDAFNSAFFKDGIPPQAKTVTTSYAAADAYFAAAVHPSNPGGTDAYFAGQARFGPDGF